MGTAYLRAMADRIDNRHPVAAPQQPSAKIKPMDLSTLLRDAFLAGRGLKDGDRLSEEDQAAWAAYDPEYLPPYKRIVAALYPDLVA